MNIPFLKGAKIYYSFSGFLFLAALGSILVFGLNFGIDFTGGSILEVNFENRPENTIIQEKLKDLNLGEIVIQPTGENGVIFRMKEIDENVHQQIISKIGEISKVEENRFENVGPVIGRELRQKTIILIVVSLLALLIYIAIAFRRVAGSISGWRYGIVSILVLTFDVLIPVGVLSILGKFYHVQFNIPIITALLTILGYTINDKVVIFDRIRENLFRNKAKDLGEIINVSLNQTIWRSLSTGTCTLLVLSAIFLFGGETLRYFSLTLIVGILVGTYSSLFLAAPLLASWTDRKKERG